MYSHVNIFGYEDEKGKKRRGELIDWIASAIEDHRVLGFVFIASTRVSTIPGISIAGSTPQDTLYTPALDVEYLLLGETISGPLPVTPDGIPTPAVISRSAILFSELPVLVVDSGAYSTPQIPHIVLPSYRVGGSIDVEDALPSGTSKGLYEEALTLASSLQRAADVFIVGESMPGGTTTAAAIMESLGYRAVERVSSASPENPHELKSRVIDRAMARSGPTTRTTVFDVVDAVGDPLHIAIAGFADGLLRHDKAVILAGGTQMCAVLAILNGMKANLGRILVATTRWLAEDESSDIAGLVKEIAGDDVTLAAADMDFSDPQYPGLRAYERGYVKEGVGAGGFMLASLLGGAPFSGLKSAIFEEYRRLMSRRR